MKKLLLAFLAATASLAAVPQAVVFDWGHVLANEDRSVVVNFMCETFQLSEADFEAVNLEKRKAVQSGKSDIDFWIEFGKQKGITLPSNWPEIYTLVIKASVGVNSEMYALIDELKAQQIRVGLLSNINSRYTKLIRDFGFYQPFDPCLLSSEIGWEKPDPKAYETLLKAMNIPAKDIVFIDDKLENVESAKKLGIDAIVFESAQQIRSALIERKLIASSLQGDQQMGYTLENQPQKFVIGISVRTSNENFQNEALPLWKKIQDKKLTEKIPNRLNQNLLAVYTSYKGDYTQPFTYIVGYEVSNLNTIPEGMIGIEIPAASYAVFTANGEFPKFMAQTWQAIWNSKLQRSYTTDFEIYPEGFDLQKSPEIKIYIAK
jgi:HAD superfamily hydrolase (TIGR01509 family)